MPDPTADPTDDSRWYTETLHEGFRTSIQARRVLFDSRTEHQRLVIAESVSFGTLVMLDGVTQLTTADEYVYHEMLSHVPILAHGAVREVLVIGGGDGGMVEEILKHPGVERVTMAELDAGVIELARTHLPELSNGAFDDPRVDIVIGDGKDFAATSERRFDLIVVDSTDPIGPGEALFTPTFYADCRRLLRPGGVIVTQNGVPFFQADELESTIRAFTRLFADATCYLAAVPTYVGGFMAFGWGTDDASLRRVPEATLEDRFATDAFATRYYTPERPPGEFRPASVHPRDRGAWPRDVDDSRPTGSVMMAPMDAIPPEALLADYPEPMRQIAETLRSVVRGTLPDAIERVRIGWRLIGYDVPVGPRRTAYCCYVAPEPEHVHLGFEYGVFMRDDEELLLGRGVTRQVRWLTFRAGDPIVVPQLEGLVREGARVARLSRGERLVSLLDREPVTTGPHRA